MTMKNIKVWTAVVTPFHEESRDIDFESYATLLKFQEAAGNGVLLMGSTGEGQSLSDKERREVLEYACSQKLDVPIMVSVGGINFDQSVEWVKFCNSCKIDAFLLSTPSYTKPGVQGQFEWFSELMNLAQKPCMIYNNPSRAGVVIYPEVVGLLKGNANAWAMKESSGLLESYYQYRRANDELDIYCGEDYLMPFVVPFKVKGLVSVASNVWPKEVLRFVNECLEGSPTRVTAEDWWEISSSLYVASNPVPTKWLLEHLGVIARAQVRVPLSINDMTKLDTLKKAHGMMGSV